MTTFDVAVIGAGMLGSPTAKYLAKRNTKVAIIGPAEPPLTKDTDRYNIGAYFDMARITRRLGWDRVWGYIDSTSLNRFGEIEAESGIPFFAHAGSLVLMGKSIAHRTEKMLAKCREDNIPVERLDEADLRKEFPFLGYPALSGGVEGLLERDVAGYLMPREIVKAQLAIAEKYGATLIRAAVHSTERLTNEGLWSLRLEKNGEQSEIRAKKVVVATGSYTNHSGVLPAGVTLNLRAFTEPNLLFELSEADQERMKTMPPVVTVDPEDTENENNSSYLVPPIRYPDGKVYLRIGPGMQPCVEELRTPEEMTKWFRDQTVLPKQEEVLRRIFKLLVPDFKPVSETQSTCIVEKTVSRYPYIGGVGETDSVTVVVGGNGHGARGSDEIGRLAAISCLGDSWDSPIEESVFEPVLAEGADWNQGDRPSYLKPPFGLC